MLKKFYSCEGISKQFMLLMCLQPFIDIYRLFVGNSIEIVGISLVELFNILFIGYLGILFILNQKKIVKFVPPIIYAIVLALYMILHCYNLLMFDTTIITGTSINIVIEIYVVLRAYVLPIMLFYMMVCICTEKERFLNTTVVISVFISSVIVLTNLFKVSYIAYASGLADNETVKQNIIEWFTKMPPENLNLITSKGWFYSGNQIGLILLMLFPIVIYYAIHIKKWWAYLVVILQCVAMMMVSTKTAAIGSLLVLAIVIVLLIIFGMINRTMNENLMKMVVLVLIFSSGVILLMKSPVIRMMELQSLSYNEDVNVDIVEGVVEGVEDTENLIDTEIIIDTETTINTEESVDGTHHTSSIIDVEVFSTFLNQNYYIYGIQEEYIKLIPVEQYPEFWLEVVQDDTKSQINFRSFKQRIYDLVKSENDNILDEYVGIGYTTNFPYLEKDFAAQNVWFGWVGTILLVGPYMMGLSYVIIVILLDMKKNFTMYNCILGLSVFAATFGAIMAGHLFGNFFPMVIYICILAQLINSVRIKEKF